MNFLLFLKLRSNDRDVCASAILRRLLIFNSHFLWVTTVHTWHSSIIYCAVQSAFSIWIMCTAATAQIQPKLILKVSTQSLCNFNCTFIVNNWNRNHKSHLRWLNGSTIHAWIIKCVRAIGWFMQMKLNGVYSLIKSCLGHSRHNFTTATNWPIKSIAIKPDPNRKNAMWIGWN